LRSAPLEAANVRAAIRARFAISAIIVVALMP